ncbi:hypothetical protein [Caballeronia mineralivorans]|uniref:hypothetical protein n=1 Tax=Caballeronia mineralivorans TaxID=2010198 RepID=UPI0009501DB3|nr:hypothetical protein [Caballeronia mineralivorans]
MSNHLDALALTEIALRAESLAAGPCNCTRTPLHGWNSQPVSLDEQRLQEIGTLVVDDDPEPSYREYLPGNIDYWSPEAPIAPRFFPYNRCNVWQCTQCSRLYLRYTEGGGYFVDRRIRAVHSALIKDVPL